MVSLGACPLQMMWFRTAVNQKLELWRQIFEAKCFRLSRSKTKCMKCDFSATTHEDGGC
jgi:hypothetical protein